MEARLASVNFFKSSGFSAESQRAVKYCVGSKATGIPNSVRMRSAITSNCRTPTTPTIHSAPISGLKTLAPPSSAICCRALPRCLDLSGSSARTLLSNSGAKLGIPVKCNFSPSVRESPIRNCPWFGIPIISPTKASSANSLS